jgi:hypothetical protein
LISSAVTGRAASNTKSVSEAFSGATRTTWPSSLPVGCGKILVMALAEPVAVGRSDSPQARAAAPGAGRCAAD